MRQSLAAVQAAIAVRKWVHMRTRRQGEVSDDLIRDYIDRNFPALPERGKDYVRQNCDPEQFVLR